MRHDFRTEFLVCLELSQDVNYVVGRSPSMEGAREVARKARTIFPDDKVYITKEMVLRQDIQQLSVKSSKSPAKSPTISHQKVAANPEPKTDKCKCGKKEGQCVGSLGCQCNPIAKCKKADKWELNPVDEVDSNDDELEDFEVEENLEFEDDEDTENDDNEEYESNPEELEEEELEEELEGDEDYQSNPDEDDIDDDEDDMDEDDINEDEDEDEDDTFGEESEDDDEDQN